MKLSRLYYGWLRSNGAHRGQTVLVPVVELDGAGREEFVKQLRMADGGVAVAG